MKKYKWRSDASKMDLYYVRVSDGRIVGQTNPVTQPARAFYEERYIGEYWTTKQAKAAVEMAALREDELRESRRCAAALVSGEAT